MACDGNLSLAERKEQQAVLAAYGGFWTHVRFRKGWAEPPFSRQDVLPLLERGAALVAMIREDLDTREPDFKLRMVDGSARDYLFSVTYSPLRQPARFVVELVHSTFKDGRGYVEELDQQQVDDYIRRFSNTTLPPHSALQSAAPRDKEDSAGSESPSTQQQQPPQQTTTTGEDTTHGEQTACEQPSSEGGEQLAAEHNITEPSAAPAAASSEPDNTRVDGGSWGPTV